MERVGAIVVAAGSGTRMERGPKDEKKQFMLLGGRPVYRWSVDVMAKSALVDEIVVVTGEEDVDRVVEQLNHESFDHVGIPYKVHAVVAGGKTRQQSVNNGLKALSKSVKWVIIHDGVRPFIDEKIVQSVLHAAQQYGSATCALPVKETVKVVDEQAKVVVHTPPRETLWAAQTPQVFSRRLLEKAHAYAKHELATDDTTLVENAGEQVKIVPGSDRNIKITTMTDWLVAQSFIEQQLVESAASLVQENDDRQRRIATGFGFDVHRTDAERPLILAGVHIDHEYGLDGHSDADVVAHAVADALLGAASLGDIGTHFPDTDMAYRDADSMGLLKVVRDKVIAERVRLLHVDVFISAEQPKLQPFIHSMRENLAHTLNVPIDWVNVKAGTGEKSGPVGRKEVIEARAVTTVEHN